MVLNGSIVVAWIASRTVGSPFGPHAWLAEPVGSLDIAATMLELLIVAGSAVLRVSRLDRG
jgi:hypothetical protein